MPASGSRAKEIKELTRRWGSSLRFRISKSTGKYHHKILRLKQRKERSSLIEITRIDMIIPTPELRADEQKRINDEMRHNHCFIYPDSGRIQQEFVRDIEKPQTRNNGS